MQASNRTWWVAAAVALVVAGGTSLVWWRISSSQMPALPTAGPPRSVIPRIDVHTHLAPSTVFEAVELLRRNHIMIALNASGGAPGSGLESSMEIARSSEGAVRPYCNVPLGRALRSDFPSFIEGFLDACKRQGAIGIKIPKSLGLGLVDAEGQLVAVDDRRLDPLFEGAGRRGLPVLIHSGDPVAFFRPPDERNERAEELTAHPDWSFFGLRPNGRPWPSWETLFEQFRRRVARHPRTQFVGAHFGNAAEYPERVAEMLDAYPNYAIDTAARIPEVGRHRAERMRNFFTRYQDRILYGSDLGYGPDGLMLGSVGQEPDRPENAARFFETQWAWFETDETGLPSPTPIQGRWTIHGIGLTREVLEKVYWRNAARIFRLNLPEGAKPVGR